MNWSIIIMFSIIVMLIGVYQAYSQTKDNKEALRYKMGKPLFSDAEKAFFHIIKNALPSQYYVIGKVRIADILSPSIARDKKLWWTSFSKISQKHFDYVVLDKASLTPLLAIELDDSSHASSTAYKRDSLVDSACETAGFALLRFPARRQYDVDNIKIQLSSHIAIPRLHEQVAIVAAPHINDKLNSSKLAKSLHITTNELLQKCLEKEYLRISDGEYELTPKGEEYGAEKRLFSGKKPYFIWPINIDLD